MVWSRGGTLRREEHWEVGTGSWQGAVIRDWLIDRWGRVSSAEGWELPQSVLSSNLCPQPPVLTCPEVPHFSEDAGTPKMKPEPGALVLLLLYPPAPHLVSHNELHIQTHQTQPCLPSALPYPSSSLSPGCTAA